MYSFLEYLQWSNALFCFGIQHWQCIFKVLFDRCLNLFSTFRDMFWCWMVWLSFWQIYSVPFSVCNFATFKKCPVSFLILFSVMFLCFSFFFEASYISMLVLICHFLSTYSFMPLFFLGFICSYVLIRFVLISQIVSFIYNFFWVFF